MGLSEIVEISAGLASCVVGIGIVALGIYGVAVAVTGYSGDPQQITEILEIGDRIAAGAGGLTGIGIGGAWTGLGLLSIRDGLY